MTTPQIKVIIVDGHPITRAGLALFLSVYSDMVLVGEATTGDEALAFCSRFEPDVILMDLKMPYSDSLSDLRAIKERHPGVKVLILTSYDDPSLVERAMGAGATGYLLKDISAFDLSSAIRDVSRGRLVLARDATEALAQVARASGDPDFELTDREKGVLALMADGLSNAEIAARLVVSDAAVKFHVGGILSKMGASSRAKAIDMAWQRNLVS